MMCRPSATGPYLVDSYERGRYIRYRRNPDYWAKDLPVRRGMYNFDTDYIQILQGFNYCTGGLQGR